MFLNTDSADFRLDEVRPIVRARRTCLQCGRYVRSPNLRVGRVEHMGVTRTRTRRSMHILTYVATMGRVNCACVCRPLGSVGVSS